MSAIRLEESNDSLPSRAKRLQTKEVELPRSNRTYRHPTATEILELIKLKKEELAGGNKPPSAEKSVSSVKEVVLPRIPTASKE